MPEAGDREEQEAARLVELCQEPGRPVWVAALRAARAELEAVADGRRWQFRLLKAGEPAADVAILSDGLVVRLPPAGPVDATLVGRAEEIAGFALGHSTLQQAMADGVFVPAANAPLDVLAQIRATVGEHLRRLVAGPAVVVVGLSRRLGWRLQRAGLSAGATLPCLFEGFAPVVVAVAAILGVGALQPTVVPARAEGIMVSSPRPDDTASTPWSTGVVVQHAAAGAERNVAGPLEPARAQPVQTRGVIDTNTAIVATIGTPGSAERTEFGYDLTTETEVTCGTPLGAVLCLATSTMTMLPTP